jgi:NADPH:quinone reductase-like Zn-dependent oxidoreductase
MGSKGDMFDVVALVQAGKLKPIVDKVLPLDKAADAHRLLAQQTQFGKIVLEVPH